MSVDGDDGDDGDNGDDSDRLPPWEPSDGLLRRALRELLAESSSSNDDDESDGDDHNDAEGDDRSNDENDDDYDEDDEDDEDGGGERRQPLPLPRDHSYLDTSHPLLPEGPSCSRRWKRPRSEFGNADGDHPHDDDGGGAGEVHRPTQTRLELAVLEVPGVVLFPGQTIPIKLRDREMVRYLGRQIRLCRTQPDLQPQVRLGILPHEPPLQHPPVRVRRRTSGQPPHEQRGSWMRRSFSSPFSIRNGLGGGRMNVVMLQDNFSLDNGDDDDDDDDDEVPNGRNNVNAPPQQHQHPFVGRVGTIATVKQTHERTTSQPILNSLPSRNNPATDAEERGERSHVSGVWGRYEDARELVFTAVGTSRFRIVCCADDDDVRGSGGGNIGRRGGNIFVVEELKDRPVPRPPIQRPFASVPWQRGAAKHFDGTRPQEKHAIDGDEGKKSNDDDDSDTGSASDSDDEPGTIPPQFDIYASLHRQSQLASNLSQLTPVPFFVYQNFSPWNLVEKIVTVLKSNNGRGNLPSLGDMERKNLDPVRFSFWMANNAPFTERERLALLRMHSVLERLVFIVKAVKQLSDQESFICCAHCNSRFTAVTDIFTVGGAEGTISTYVNTHGCIHQITTLRTINERKVAFQGIPCTDNSYFPGYSWLITHCRRCASHLGWKFQKVPSRSTSSSSSTQTTRVDSPDRPKIFYGFMSSNVVTSHS